MDEDTEYWSPAYEAAAARTRFQLTYAAATKPRTFEADVLTGPLIPCAYHHGTPDAHSAPGEWHYGEIPSAVSEEDWLRHFFQMAVQEAVHEALEWFHVDDQPAIDPHSFEIPVSDLSAQLAHDLWQLRQED